MTTLIIYRSEQPGYFWGANYENGQMRGSTRRFTSPSLVAASYKKVRWEEPLPTDPKAAVAIYCGEIGGESRRADRPEWKPAP
jgi:hypothetical protein